MGKPKLLTIVLNYKTPDMTFDAIAAAMRELDGINGEMIVVDNDSQDGSFEKLHQAVSDAGWLDNNRVRVVQSGHNGGFGAGNNFGIRTGLSSGDAPDYVYILNSDAFPDKGAIHALLDHLQGNPNVGFAGSYIHGPEGDHHTTAFRFPSIASEFEAAISFGPISKLLSERIVPLPLPDKTSPVDWLAGASMMMRWKTLVETGLFDERFFLYFEETDLCRRAKLAGWPTVYVRESNVTHIGSVSTGMKTVKRMPGYWFDSRLHYFNKNHGVIYTSIATLAHLAGGGLWHMRAFIQRKKTQDPPNFLRDMMKHSLRKIFGATSSQSRSTVPANDRITRAESN